MMGPEESPQEWAARLTDDALFVELHRRMADARGHLSPTVALELERRFRALKLKLEVV